MMDGYVTQELRSVERKLPAWLNAPEMWTGIHITYQKPHVDRLWLQDGLSRVYLHRIHQCGEEDAFFHTHPWPSAMRVLAGIYKMRVGFEHRTAATIRLLPGSEYEMSFPGGMHSVQPLTETTLSLMVTHAPWEKAKVSDRKYEHTPMTEEAKDQLLEDFKVFYG